MSNQRKADLALVLVTLFWGVSYYLVNLCLAELQPMNLNAFRFLLAFLVLGPIFWKKLRNASRATLKYSVIIGALLVGVYAGATYGVAYTSISNAGFICALPVVFTPLLDFAVNRRKPGKKLAVALVMCTVGLALLTLNDQFHPASGDLICLVCAVCYAADMLVTERAVARPDVDAVTLGVCQLGVAGVLVRMGVGVSVDLITIGVLMLLVSALVEQPRLPQSPGIWGAAIFLGLFCSGVAFVIQSVAQQYTTASHVGVIFTLEPVFSGIVAYFFADEKLLPRGYVGAALMLLSLLVMETDWSGLLKKLRAGHGE